MQNNKINKPKIKIIAIVAVIIIITNLLTFMFTSSANMVIGNKLLINTPSVESAKNINKMIELEKIINENYYKQINEQDLWDYAFKGLFIGTGDKYTNYYTQEEFNSYMQDMQSDFVGIGVEIQGSTNGSVKVNDVFENSPASKAGMKEGDIIIKVDDFDSTKSNVNEVSKRLRGKKGTEVNVTVLRKEEKINLTITRDEIHNKKVSGKMIDNIGYISISEFTSDVSKYFENYYDSFNKQGMKGLIIDMRDNPGGLVIESINIANNLLKKDMKIISVTNKSGETQTEKDTTKKHADIPVVVLLNGGSASASEILACALKDNNVATIIGEKSYGKGIIQDVKSLNDGSGMTITTQEYVSPKGSKIHGKGIAPDIEVKLNSKKDIKDLTLNQDNQLQKAISYLKQNIK